MDRLKACKVLHPCDTENRKLLLSILWQMTLISLLFSATPEHQPLIQKSNFTFLGAFALPLGDYGGSRFGYGGRGITHYLDASTNKHTLFIEGHAYFPGFIAQVEVPSDDQLVKSRLWNDLNIATVLQNFSDITDGNIQDVGYMPFVYGMLVYNGRLIVSASSYYDGDAAQVNTHGVSGLNLATASDFQGFFPMTGTATPRSKGGYMTTIPAEWRTRLGGSGYHRQRLSIHHQQQFMWPLRHGVRSG